MKDLTYKDDFSFLVSVLDEFGNPIDNLDNFMYFEDALDYAKNNLGTGVFHERFRKDKNICEYELIWHNNRYKGEE